MKVSSPVGDFPFEARRLSVKDGRMIVEGAMGAWPTQIEVEPRDIVQLARLVPWPAIALGGIALASLVRRSRRRTARG